MRVIHMAVATMVGIAAMSGGIARAAETTVERVELQDPSTDSTIASMRMKLDHDSLKAGPVRFEVTNESKGLVHEMIVIKTTAPASALPYDSKSDRAIESKIKSLGEVSELQPGASGHLTLNMKPGAYLLFCNQPNHLRAGMWARFVVTSH
jgi:uncharacterized cupredoxin-like copper-binding protein